MNDLMNVQVGKLTMSSLEIAELTGKVHNNVMRDIKTMLEELGATSDQFRSDVGVPGPNGAVRKSPIYSLPKDLTLTLVSGYNIKLRYKVIKRLEELENGLADETRTLSEIDAAKRMIEMSTRYLAALEAKAALQDRVDRSALFARTVPEDDGSAFTSVADINESVVPWEQDVRFNSINATHSTR